MNLSLVGACGELPHRSSRIGFQQALSSPLPFVIFHVEYLEFFDRIMTKGACSNMAFVEATRSMWGSRQETMLLDALDQFYRAFVHWGELRS